MEPNKITQIKEQQRNPERLSVFINGRYSFPITRMMAEHEGLKVGQTLSSEDIERLQRADTLLKARDAAYRLLTYRPRSVTEIRTRLTRKGYDPDVIDSVIEYLEGAGYLDDREFARFWIENRESFSPRGTRLLKAELRQKGVDSDIIEESIEEDSSADQAETALEMARRKAAGYRGLEREAFYRRLAGFLQRRGFEYSVVSGVVKRVWQESTNGNMTEPDRYVDMDS